MLPEPFLGRGGFPVGGDQQVDRSGPSAQNLEEEKTRLFLNVQKKYEKILSEFIPICASCKNVSDEEGMWHQLEAYVQKRTDATFSHGICPDCLKKLYPYFENK